MHDLIAGRPAIENETHRISRALFFLARDSAIDFTPEYASILPTDPATDQGRALTSPQPPPSSFLLLPRITTVLISLPKKKKKERRETLSKLLT